MKDRSGRLRCGLCVSKRIRPFKEGTYLLLYRCPLLQEMLRTFDTNDGKMLL